MNAPRPPFVLTDTRLEVYQHGLPLLAASDALDAMQEWAMSAGIGPDDIALPGYVQVNPDGSVTYDRYVRDAEKRVVQDPQTKRAAREAVTVPRPPLGHPDPWPAALRELVRLNS